MCTMVKSGQHYFGTTIWNASRQTELSENPTIRLGENVEISMLNHVNGVLIGCGDLDYHTFMDRIPKDECLISPVVECIWHAQDSQNEGQFMIKLKHCITDKDELKTVKVRYGNISSKGEFSQLESDRPLSQNYYRVDKDYIYIFTDHFSEFFCTAHKNRLRIDDRFRAFISADIKKFKRGSKVEVMLHIFNDSKEKDADKHEKFRKSERYSRNKEKEEKTFTLPSDVNCREANFVATLSLNEESRGSWKPQSLKSLPSHTEWKPQSKELSQFVPLWQIHENYSMCQESSGHREEAHLTMIHECLNTEFDATFAINIVSTSSPMQCLLATDIYLQQDEMDNIRVSIDLKSPPKQSIHFCRVECSKLRGGQMVSRGCATLSIELVQTGPSLILKFK